MKNFKERHRLLYEKQEHRFLAVSKGKLVSQLLSFRNSLGASINWRNIRKAFKWAQNTNQERLFWKSFINFIFSYIKLFSITNNWIIIQSKRSVLQIRRSCIYKRLNRSKTSYHHKRSLWIVFESSNLKGH